MRGPLPDRGNFTPFNRKFGFFPELFRNTDFCGEWR